MNRIVLFQEEAGNLLYDARGFAGICIEFSLNTNAMRHRLECLFSLQVYLNRNCNSIVVLIYAIAKRRKKCCQIAMIPIGADSLGNIVCIMSLTTKGRLGSYSDLDFEPNYSITGK